MGADAEPDETLIVGAGAAGLAVAAVLSRRGLPYTIIDRSAGVGATWADRYDSLKLHTARQLSGLPGRPIPRSSGPWVSRDDFVAYLQAYADDLSTRPQFGIDVQWVERVTNGWRVLTSSGDRTARRVVIASGYTRTPTIPDWPGRATFVGQLLHSSQYRSPRPYEGRDVLVVGAGNSATEIAVDLLGVAASVSISVRTPPNIVRRDILGMPSQMIGLATRPLPEAVMNPMSALLRRVSVPDLSAFGLPAPPDGFSQYLRSQVTPVLDHGFVAAVRDRRITVLPAIESIVGDEVRLVDHTIHYPQVIIAGTGYSPDLRRVLPPALLDERGTPRVHGSATLPAAPDLYVVGISVQLTGQLHEIGQEAEQVGRALAHRPS